MLQCLSKVGGGVNYLAESAGGFSLKRARTDIGSNDQVKALALETLLYGVFGDIEHLVLDCGEPSESFLRRTEETRRHVGESVRRVIAIVVRRKGCQQGQNRICRTKSVTT